MIISIFEIVLVEINKIGTEDIYNITRESCHGYTQGARESFRL